jgi:superfamily II DNA or RNA helicase
MTKLFIKKIDEAFVKVDCEKDLAQELSTFFTFYVPGYKFIPAYKNKLWDGKIRLFNLQNKSIYYGLLSYIIKFCDERDYECIIDDNVDCTENYSIEEAKNFIKSLNVPHEPRDYQINAFVQAISKKKILLLSPTASGKSFILYMIIRHLRIANKKGLLIVPTTSLVEQMYTDFESYGFDSEKYCHRQYSGKEKHTDKFLTISTWQSIYKNPSSYFEEFDFVIGDEAHQFKAKSLTTILSSCKNAKYRIGTTGTLDGTHTHRLVLEGLFGEVFKATSTSELINKNQLSKFRIKCLVLKHDENICTQSKKWDYDEEMDFLVRNETRNNFIKNLTLSLKGNSLILFQFVEKQGKILYEIIKNSTENRHVFFVYGDTDVEIRESIRSITEKENDVIIIASYGTFSTGVNIRNLHNIIFASPSKSRVRNLQSIGRVLRLGENKEEAMLYDISDDLRSGKKNNHTLNHFLERVKIYNEEKFEYKLYNIDLKPRNQGK